MPDQHLDPDVALHYDRGVAARFDSAHLDPTVDLLADLADGGPVLEFAVGTGRVALPLAARGLDVHGIDFSEPMVEQLRAKPGGADLPVTMGDMTTTDAGRSDFALAFLVFNTIGNVTTQHGQVAVFDNAARHLRPGGRFLTEVIVPALQDRPLRQRHRVYDISDEHVGIDDYHDPVNQLFDSLHWRFDGNTVRKFGGTFRWVWPSELDLMAQCAGLTFESRWADFERSPFTADSESHVSVWRKPI